MFCHFFMAVFQRLSTTARPENEVEPRTVTTTRPRATSRSVSRGFTVTFVGRLVDVPTSAVYFVFLSGLTVAEKAPPPPAVSVVTFVGVAAPHGTAQITTWSPDRP